MIINWYAYQQRLNARVDELSRLTPETVRGYLSLCHAGEATGHIDAKTRELIALAVAVTLRCDGSILKHTDAAVECGASRAEVAEALGVAVSINAGSALVYSARVMDACAERMT